MCHAESLCFTSIDNSFKKATLEGCALCVVNCLIALLDMLCQLNSCPSAVTDEVQPYSLRFDKVFAPPCALPIVILPGFGNNSSDYLQPFLDRTVAIATHLRERGFSVYVLPVERLDWLNVGKMIFSSSFYTTKCTTEQGYSWYLQRVSETINRACMETGCDQVHLVGHSAGGWLARAFIGGAYGTTRDTKNIDSNESPHPQVKSLVTLGTPHFPPPPHKSKDRTGGALTWVNARWPGAYFKTQRVKYVSVAAKTITADKDKPKLKTLSGYAHGCYLEVCGEGHGVQGDAVVPVDSALLEGADHVILDGVLHSMSKVGDFEQKGDFPWYGSDVVLDSWLKYLIEE